MWAVVGSSIVVVLLVALAAAVFRQARSAADGRIVGSSLHFVVAPPPGGTFRRNSPNAGPAGVAATPFPTLSPDGRHLAFAAAVGAEPSRLWIRDLDDVAPRPLAGTEDAGFFLVA